jgi:hypothetical protein
LKTGGQHRQLEQYLGRYAEREVGIAEALDRDYRRVLIVPVHREDTSLLDGYRRAALLAPGRTLCIVVVNDTEVSAESRGLLDGLSARLEALRVVSSEPPALLGRLPELDVLVIDRASDGFTLPATQGVGLARKIGSDLALAMWHRRQIETPLLYSSDADVLLPDDYFESALGAPEAAARLYRFWHEPSGDAEIDQATALYEISLRYYVLGLRAAGSPYAMHTVGSTICIDAAAYAAVRGFPRRKAGEDFYILDNFYMLDKLAKLGGVADVPGSPIRIRSRRSERVPFGTGRGVGRLLETRSLSLYDPELFALLGRFLTGLDEFAVHGDAQRFLADLVRAPGRGVQPLLELALAWQLPAVLAGARSQASDVDQLRRRLHTWFDAFRTLKLIHTLRDRGLPVLPWRAAFAGAAFLPRELAGEGDLDSIRRSLSRLEIESSRRLGPTSLGTL